MRHNDSRVSRGGPQDDVLVEKNDQDMGAYSVQPLAGIMGLGASDFIPPVAGGLSYTLSTWLIGRFGGGFSTYLSRFAPLLGGVLGAILSGVAVPFATGGGKKVAVQAAATSLTMGVMSQLLREVQGAGLGAVVMERIAGTSMGALPRVTSGGGMPGRIRQTMDRGVYGKTWA
ncbi:MAG: hypothetical protein ABII76_22215 [Pseudomonadota bacterium]